jgi:hypothetical protein
LAIHHHYHHQGERGGAGIWLFLLALGFVLMFLQVAVPWIVGAFVFYLACRFTPVLWLLVIVLKWCVLVPLIHFGALLLRLVTWNWDFSKPADSKVKANTRSELKDPKATGLRRFPRQGRGQ